MSILEMSTASFHSYLRKDSRLGLGAPPERIKVTSQRDSASHPTPCPQLEPMPCGFSGSMAPRLRGFPARVLEQTMPAIITSRLYSSELKPQKVRFYPSRFQPGAMDQKADFTQSLETWVTGALSSPKLVSKVTLLQQRGMVQEFPLSKIRGTHILYPKGGCRAMPCCPQPQPPTGEAA